MCVNTAGLKILPICITHYKQQSSIGILKIEIRCKLFHLLNIAKSYLLVRVSLGTQVWNSKIDFNMEALSISCRNKHWSKYFHRILISSTGYLTICLAIVVQAALESRAACTTIARHIVRWPVDEIKIRLKHCDQCLFLQSMLSASIFK